MKKENRKYLCIALGFLASFVVWTILVSLIDLKAIGPQESYVGFAHLNKAFHSLTGVNMFLYTLTDWLSLIPIICILGFALLGLIQWIKRKNLFKIDLSILILGGFYFVTLFLFVFFEIFVINYRPILIEGILEASYPSSTTLLVMCVMPTTLMQLKHRIKNVKLKRCVQLSIIAYTLFMVVCRLVSGVHWLTDIIGGMLLSIGLVLTYYSLTKE